MIFVKLPHESISVHFLNSNLEKYPLKGFGLLAKNEKGVYIPQCSPPKCCTKGIRIVTFHGGSFLFYHSYEPIYCDFVILLFFLLDIICCN